MTIVVITGSTRGIGYGLADSFLALECSVVLSGRRSEAVARAVASLAARHAAERVAGFACDVTSFEQVQALWDAASGRFGRVDIWINNAGISNSVVDFWDLSPQEVSTVMTTNIIGAMYGSIVALRGMRRRGKTEGSGALYNMEGLGSDGRRKVKGLAPYGATKAALRYLDEALVEETRGQPMLVGAILPGMVATEMITGQFAARPEEWERSKRILNILSERVETVTPWIARRVLENKKTGVRISYMNGFKLLGRFLTASFRPRRVFEDAPPPPPAT